jgi:hypothetical protein
MHQPVILDGGELGRIFTPALTYPVSLRWLGPRSEPLLAK